MLIWHLQSLSWIIEVRLKNSGFVVTDCISFAFGCSRGLREEEGTQLVGEVSAKYENLKTGFVVFNEWLGYFKSTILVFDTGVNTIF